jgi:hypothetical protein
MESGPMKGGTENLLVRKQERLHVSTGSTDGMKYSDFEAINMQT